jgi:phosphotransferase system HPr (HPr) family protein
MTEPIARRTVTIVNPQGLHARPADLFVRMANQYGSTIRVKKGNETVDGKSILSILTLAAAAGCQLEISATGDDADAALAALCSLVEQGFCIDEMANHESTNQPSDSSAPDLATGKSVEHT